VRLYNNLSPVRLSHLQLMEMQNTDAVLELTLRIDETIKQVRPDDWRGVQAKEQHHQAALYGILQRRDEVERIFFIITQHKEY